MTTLGTHFITCPGKKKKNRTKKFDTEEKSQKDQVVTASKPSKPLLT